MKTLICAFMILVAVNAQTLTSDGCYYEYLNTKVMCLEPWEVCKNIANCDECMAVCTQFAGTCKSVVYQQSTQECYLYCEVVKPSYGRKKRMAGCYGNMPPSLKKNEPDFTYYMVSNSSTCNGGYKGVTTAVPPITKPPTQLTNPPTAPTNPPTPPTPPTNPPNPPTPPTMPPQPTAPTVFSDAPSSTTRALPPQATCPAGQLPIFVEYVGSQMSGTPDTKYQAGSEQECSQACAANQQPSGVIAPCQSADFNTASMQCSFFLNASPPTGTGQLSTATGVNHYDKTCMDSTVVQSCPGPIKKYPQKLLVGYAESVVTATNELDCTTQCMQSQQRFGFLCMSGMFYTSESTNNCILNSESATTQPALFTDETVDKVNYFEPICMGGGAAGPQASKKGPAPVHKRPRRDAANLKPTRKRNIIWPNMPNWGSWTRCDGQLSTRYHYRNCKSFNPNKCEVASEQCDPSNREKEMQDILKEEQGDGNNGGGNDGKVEAVKKGQGKGQGKGEQTRNDKEKERDARKDEHDKEKENRNKNNNRPRK